MKLLDVNILVAAYREDALDHPMVSDWLHAELAKPTGVAVSDLILSGFLRVVTHPKVFKTPTPLSMAMDFLDHLRSLPAVTVVSPGSRHWEIFVDLCRGADARGNLIPDAYHAAMALEFGIEWITLDRGFARYPGLRWSLPTIPNKR